MTNERYNEIYKAFDEAWGKDVDADPNGFCSDAAFGNGPAWKALEESLGDDLVEYRMRLRAEDESRCEKNATDMGGWSTY